MFQTGSGKPVTVKQDSFRKAVAILEGEDTKKGVLLFLFLSILYTSSMLENCRKGLSI